MTRVAAAVVQAAPVAFDLEATVAKVERLTADAAGGGAALVVFPEAFVSCYPRGITFGATVGARSPEGREEFRGGTSSSGIDVPGSAVGRLRASAGRGRRGPSSSASSSAPRSARSTARSCSSHPEGAFLGKHRKLMPTAARPLVEWRRLDDAGVRHGLRQARRGHLLGELHAAPAHGQVREGRPGLVRADGRRARNVDRDHASHRLRGSLFVLSANQFATRGDYPSDYPLQDSGGDAGDVLCRGGSVIVSPLGDVLAGPAFGQEAVLHADLDFDRIAEAKYDFDVVGHYARPDVFTLTVDERPRPPVVELDA